VHPGRLEPAVHQIDVALDPADAAASQLRRPEAEDGQWIAIVVAAGDIGIAAADHRQVTPQPAARHRAASQHRRAELVARPQQLERRRRRHQLGVRRQDAPRIGGPGKDRRAALEIDHVHPGGRRQPQGGGELGAQPSLQPAARRLGSDRQTGQQPGDQRDSEGPACQGRSVGYWLPFKKR
jgi:hypothetical protein